MIRRFTSAQLFPQSAGAQRKNQSGSGHYGMCRVALRHFNRNGFFRRKRQELADKRLRVFSDWGCGSQAVPPPSCLMSRPWITRFSSRSARGRRMMGSGGRGVSICPATFGALLPSGSGLSARSPRPSSPRERRRLRPFRRKLQFPSSRRHSLLTPAELGVVDPHAVQDDRQLARDRDPSARHAAPLRYLHAPGP
jgi:hypothetical protein